MMEGDAQNDPFIRRAWPTLAFHGVTTTPSGRKWIVLSGKLQAIGHFLMYIYVHLDHYTNFTPEIF
jgi:hypothetical protein